MKGAMRRYRGLLQECARKKITCIALATSARQEGELSDAVSARRDDRIGPGWAQPETPRQARDHRIEDVEVWGASSAACRSYACSNRKPKREAKDRIARSLV